MSVRDLHLRFFLLLASVLSVGCTHLQLRKNTLDQMQTVHDIQEQQVLDNLAMFVANPNAFPYFSMAAQGSSQVADQASLSATTGWERVASVFYFYQFLATPSANRVDTENWTLTPINDSVKLSLMRCAYQRAVSSCMKIQPSCVDPDCNALFETFYPPPKWTFRGSVCCATESAASSPAKGLPHVPGIVTPNGPVPQFCWFCWGPKAAVPENMDCNFVGHYRNTYVWVPPQGRNELTKLILIILDIAFYDPPPQAPARTVNIAINPEGSDGASANQPKPSGSSSQMGEHSKGFQQIATVPIGTGLDAVKLAHDVMALKQLLAGHALTEDGLIDYWCEALGVRTWTMRILPTSGTVW